MEHDEVSATFSIGSAELMVAAHVRNAGFAVFDNSIVTKDITDEVVFELIEAIPGANFAQNKDNTRCLFHAGGGMKNTKCTCSIEICGNPWPVSFEITTASKELNFENKTRDVKSQLIQKCSLLKIRNKGLSLKLQCSNQRSWETSYLHQSKLSMHRLTNEDIALHKGEEEVNTVSIVVTRWLEQYVMRIDYSTSATRVGHRTKQMQNRIQDVKDIRTRGLRIQPWERNV